MAEEPEVVERQVVAIEDVVEYGALEDGTGIVIEVRLADGQIAPLQVSIATADAIQIAIVRSKADAAAIREQRGTEPQATQILPGVPIVATGLTVMSSPDGATALLVAEAPPGQIPPIVLSMKALSELRARIVATEHELARRRPGTSH